MLHIRLHGMYVCTNILVEPDYNISGICKRNCRNRRYGKTHTRGFTRIKTTSTKSLTDSDYLLSTAKHTQRSVAKRCTVSTLNPTLQKKIWRTLTIIKVNQPQRARTTSVTNQHNCLIGCGFNCLVLLQKRHIVLAIFKEHGYKFINLSFIDSCSIRRFVSINMLNPN